MRQRRGKQSVDNKKMHRGKEKREERRVGRIAQVLMMKRMKSGVWVCVRDKDGEILAQ